MVKLLKNLTLLAAALFSATAWSQYAQYTVVTLPNPIGYPPTVTVQATDGANAQDCKVGGGNYTVNCNAFRGQWLPSISGSSIVPGRGVWERRGVVNYGNYAGYASAVEEPTVILDTNPQILTGVSPVFKMWFSANTDIGYAESQDGIQWTLSPTNVIAAHYRSSVLKVGSTYYFWGAATTGNHIDEYTSSDGVTWTESYASVLPTATAPFSQAGLTNTSEVVYNGTLYLFIEINAGLALYTSTDMHTFTASSLVQPANNYWRGPAGPFLENSTWYLWTHGTCPAGTGGGSADCIGRLSAPALTGPWTQTGVTELVPATLDEGVGTAQGQVADPFLLEVNGKTYLYYTAGQYTTGYRQETKLAIADMPISSLVQTQGGGDYGSLDNPGGAFDMTFDYTTGGINFGGRPLENVGGFSTFGYNGAEIDMGCAVTGEPQQCNNGWATLNLWSATSGTQYNASIVVNPNGGAGMTFNLPRDTGTIGYFFKNHAGTTLMYIDSASGLAQFPAIKATSGDRYVCVDTNGNLVSQASACSGT